MLILELAISTEAPRSTFTPNPPDVVKSIFRSFTVPILAAFLMETTTAMPTVPKICTESIAIGVSSTYKMLPSLEEFISIFKFSKRTPVLADDKNKRNELAGVQLIEKSRNELLLPRKNSWATEDTIVVASMPLPTMWVLAGTESELVMLKVPGATLIIRGASGVGCNAVAFNIAASIVLNWAPWAAT